jgi:CheY-like chemotaxis protein
MSNPRAGCIFLIDDDSATLDLAERFLKNRGYSTVIAKDGEEALLLLTTKRFDLIISDIDMPRMDGMRLLELMQINCINTPLLFLTANISADCEEKARKAGAKDFIHKPIKKEAFVEKIAAVLSNSRAKHT